MNLNKLKAKNKFISTKSNVRPQIFEKMSKFNPTFRSFHFRL